jgi:hypothetical protein
MGDPGKKTCGNGVLFWFELEEFSSVFSRSQEMNSDIVRPKHHHPPSGNGGPHHGEHWLRDSN